MLYLSGLTGFLLVLTADALFGNSSQMNFCTETDQCLFYDLVCKTNKYEVRRYDSVKWVSTNETSFSMEMVMLQSFRRLFNYISGQNEEGKKIAMTAPVVIKTPVKDFWERGVFTMSFLLPAEYQQNPPKPTQENVYIEETPDMKVYVQSYGGYMTGFTDTYNSNKLSSSLDANGAKYKGSHYSVGYNSPMAVFNRHNEVWLEVEGEPVCPTSE